MDKGILPSSAGPPPSKRKQSAVFIRGILFLLLFGCIVYPSISLVNNGIGHRRRVIHRPLHADRNLARCSSLKDVAAPPPDFHARTKSDRFVAGTPPTWIKNARIWTGNDNGTEVLHGDIFIDQGLVKEIGNVEAQSIRALDAEGSWVTPGISQSAGVGAAPGLEGADDVNSLKAFPIKLRHTEERTPGSMLVEPAIQVQYNGSASGGFVPWRENPTIGMDTIWHFRESYNEARKLVQSQDDYCAKAEANQWADLGDFPEDLQWEALADVIRGRVKVNIHCYEAVDIDDLVRLSNEFKFPIAAFHHAHETYLVPETLKKAWGIAYPFCAVLAANPRSLGPTPGAALFATLGRYKKEAYRGSEFAPRILASHGIDVSMKSDHSVLDSRFLIYEAQQAHFYGLPENLALASVITTSARRAGLDHRLGYIREGWDADLIIWDSHPLNLAATPKQVFIDGIAQLDAPLWLQELLPVPNFDKEAEEAVKWDGLPPLKPKATEGDVIFLNVATIFSREAGEIRSQVLPSSQGVAQNARPMWPDSPRLLIFQGGSIFPGLTTFGSPLGVSEIDQEDSTNDGIVYDPFSSGRFAGDNTLFRAFDGLSYGGRDELLAYVYGGVTTAVSAPRSYGFFSGLGVAFSLGADHKLEKGAVVQDITAVHITVSHLFGSKPSVSTQIGVLRKLLLEDQEWFGKVANGTIPLVVAAASRDIIASLLSLKKEIENAKGSILKLTIAGGSEAHLLAKELGEAGVGVIIDPPKPFPTYWEDRRILAGPPLTEDTVVTKLRKHNVTVALGITESWQARNLRFELGYAALQAGGSLSVEQALSLATTNVEKLLGVDVEANNSDLVAMSGGSLLDFTASVAAILSPRRGCVDLVREAA
ncbi:carbohydrate esterase family 9 protein [Flagelloscypha sp. PMI_526]|nr:carbohydrate esterase family 9 protein [Flagelloscypha sp. PMI_526]